MKKSSVLILSLALAMGAIIPTMAASVKKNPPKNKRAVEEILKAIGGDHYPNAMSVSTVGSVKTDSTYFHIYRGEYVEDNIVSYHVIIFDNTPKYLGFYDVPDKPNDVGDGEIILVNEDNPDEEIVIPITDKGPAKGVRLAGGVTAEFVAAPVPEEEKKQEATEESATQPSELPSSADVEQTEPEQQPEQKDTIKPEYRTWTVMRDGQKITFPAIYVEMKDKKTIILKSAKNGNTAEILLTELSNEDKRYLQKLLQ